MADKTMKSNETAVPEGMDFLELVLAQERACEQETSAIQSTLGEKAPKCLAAIGTVLSLTDRLSSCWWGCAGGDHVIEYLAGRSVASARATLRLCLHGYYDEALGLTRSVGEIANLLALFAADTSALGTWQSATRRKRQNEFSPAAVRRKLVTLGAPLPVSEERYRLLCEVATHVTPDTLPQGHNPLLLPVLGGKFQTTGYLLALNELAIPITFVGLFSASLLKADASIRNRFAVAGRALAEAIGGVNLVDGYPRLNNQAIAELKELIGAAPLSEQPSLSHVILRMAEGRSITGSGDPNSAEEEQ